jgi:ribose 5-phosphate isomerase A
VGEAEKRIAGEYAARLVKDGDHVGLGTGSTVKYAIEGIARRISLEGLKISGVATSTRTEELAGSLGITLIDIDDVEKLDIAIDGADEINPSLDLIKGLGGALFREKVVASLAERFVIVAEQSKYVEKLGTRSPLPVEVARFGSVQALHRLSSIEGVQKIDFRRKDGKPFITDNGNYVIDLWFKDGIENPAKLREKIESTLGVLTSGLFLGMATEVVLSDTQGVRVLERSER